MEAALDHLVVAGPDLAALCRWWRDASGISPEPGGAHEGRGTRNALVGLGPSSYLELIARDPDQPDPRGPRPFGVDQLVVNDPVLVTFALAVRDLDEATEQVRSAGIDPGQIVAMQRRRPDGSVLQWRLAVPPDPTLGGVSPFLIEWGASAHPAADLVATAALDQLELGHPNRAPIQRALTSLGSDIEVRDAERPTLRVALSVGTRLIRLPLKEAAL